jgi:two-component system, OmpR family, alkaline phosphatase synthesis response regulator PhoP
MERQSKYRILVVDDEPDILEFLSYNIEKAGYEISTAMNGRDALIAADKMRPHLIILDVMMPGVDGIETCEELRKSPVHREAIIVFLTARSEDYSQIAGFAAGADDYISKPIKPKVLISRIGALLRRVRKSEPNSEDWKSSNLESDGIVVDRERFLVICNGNELALPKKEFELLTLLMSKPEKVFTRDEIFGRIWDSSTIVGERTIDVHIRKLREKLGDRYIKTVKGVGYKFSGI